MTANLEQEVRDAEGAAWRSLAAYKFVMFGYHVGVWVHLNRLRERPGPNPFRELVHIARRQTT